MSTRPLTRDEAEDFFATFYRGKHHIPEKGVRDEGGGSWYVAHYNAGAGLSSFDYDDLTRLVFMAHDRGVRVSLHSSAPNYVKIRISHQRSRPPGDMSTVHPTLEQAVDKWREDPDGSWWKRLEGGSNG
ncbi:MAG: hypothetical protein HOW73_20215 [Polyangiaceae bacterium]|nr:hypothetical protein [Polyangiaceae bacterium]